MKKSKGGEIRCFIDVAVCYASNLVIGVVNILFVSTCGCAIRPTEGESSNMPRVCPGFMLG